MRIALISTPFVACPPSNYGGTELIVYELAEGLVKRGHQVVLYATGDSRTSAELRYIYPEAVWPPAFLTEMEHVAFCYQDMLKARIPFDIVHAHSVTALQLARLMPATPMVYTVHHKKEEDLSRIYTLHSEAHYVFISDRQQAIEAVLAKSSTIHHGLEPSRYPFNADPGEYFAFLGRFAPYKGLLTAIDVASQAGVTLRIAGQVHDEIEYYEQQLKPRFSDPGIEYIGSADHAMKVELLSGARALLFPIAWEEPFGLVMIEAMLCGTPVLAFGRGSVPEVVDDGITGFVVRDRDEMLARIHDVHLLDRATVRRHAVRRFGVERMVDDYLRLYQDILADKQEPARELQSVYSTAI